MGIENVLKKGVKFTLDKERTVAYPMAAMAYLSEQYGSIPEAFQQFNSIRPAGGIAIMGVKMIETVAHFLTAGLISEDPEVNYHDVMSILDLENMISAITAVSEGLTAYLPKVVAKSEATPTKRPKS